MNTLKVVMLLLACGGCALSARHSQSDNQKQRGATVHWGATDCRLVAEAFVEQCFYTDGWQQQVSAVEGKLTAQVGDILAPCLSDGDKDLLRKSLHHALKGSGQVRLVSATAAASSSEHDAALPIGQQVPEAADFVLTADVAETQDEVEGRPMSSYRIALQWHATATGTKACQSVYTVRKLQR